MPPLLCTLFHKKRSRRIVRQNCTDGTAQKMSFSMRHHRKGQVESSHSSGRNDPITNGGVCSEEIFLKRNTVLQKDIKELQSSIEELEEICHNKSEYEQAREIFLPTTAHILDYYDWMTAEEKNRLWKLLMEKITYYRSPEKPDSIEIHLYPRLGRFVNLS